MHPVDSAAASSREPTSETGCHTVRCLDYPAQGTVRSQYGLRNLMYGQWELDSERGQACHSQPRRLARGLCGEHQTRQEQSSEGMMTEVDIPQPLDDSSVRAKYNGRIAAWQRTKPM